MQKTIKQKTKNFNWKKYIPLFALLVILGCLIYFQFGPRPSVRYFWQVIEKVGAPEGFVVIPERERFNENLFQSSYGRRSYAGEGNPEAIKKYMIERLKKMGFKNARYQSGAGLKAGGVIASCQGMSVFVRIYQENDDPIDIEAFPSDAPYRQACPWIL